MKQPTPGAVKTRLAPTLGDAGAAELARAMLADTLVDLSGLPVELAVDTPGSWLPPGVPVRPQGGGDLGARLERVLGEVLQDVPWVIALGADTPGVPRPALDGAIEALKHHDAVIGPTPDGGYWLLGLRRCPPGLLHDLPWSQPHTRSATEARLRSRGLTVAEADPWFDLDEPADLALLLARPEVPAVQTRAALSRLRAGRSGPSSA